MNGQDVLARVNEELAYEPSLREDEVRVSIEGAAAVLNGTVESYRERLAAETAARRVKGVGSVANMIEVVLPEKHRRADEQLLSVVRQVFEWTIDVPRDLIGVSVENGVVTLRGEVDWRFQKEAAERAVEGLIGVRGLCNHIRVNPRHAEPRLKDAVEAALQRSSLCDIGQIEIEAQGDRIILSGSVSSWADRDEAERIAWAAPGVRDVDCRLRVNPCANRRAAFV